MENRSNRYVFSKTYSCNPEFIILALGLFLFLRIYACIVHLFSQERKRSCPPEVHPPNFMRGGRRVDVMSTLVKGDQEILHLKEHPRG
jgi:hypothetical protein